jgi:tetratricopeptide (TPR) repeat protein
MPVAEFARMRRHDHSLLPPTPSSTRVFGSPNACNNCHRDRDAAWADAAVRTWHAEDYQAPVMRRARWIDRARAGDWTQLDAMLASLHTEAEEPVYVASILRLLTLCDDPRKVPAFIGALEHPSPLVQAAAAGALEGCWTAAALPGLTEAAGHPTRLVRVRAAQALATLPEDVLQPAPQLIVDRAFREFEHMLEIQRDNAGAREALGHFRLDRGRLEDALAAFEQGLTLAPDNLGLLISAASIARRTGRPDRAEQCLQHAVQVHPHNTSAWFNWVAFLDTTGKADAARTARRHALRSLDDTGRKEFQTRWERWTATRTYRGR